MNVVWILPLVLVAIVLVYAYLRNKKKKDKFIEETTLLKVYSDAQERTPLGVLIASKNGTSIALKNIIDVALTDVFQDAIADGQSRGVTYTQKLQHSDYTIYVLDDCTPSPEQHVPSFKLRADEYDGSIFDQDPRNGIGYILASEYVIQDNNAPTGEYVICNDLDNAYNNTRYGAEHILLYWNERNKYEETRYHGSGIYHPLIPSS